MNPGTGLDSVPCCLTHSKKTRLTPPSHFGSSSSIYGDQGGWDRQVTLEGLVQVVVWSRVVTSLARVLELPHVLWHSLGGGQGGEILSLGILAPGMAPSLTLMDLRLGILQSVQISGWFK